jgi:heptosyltransferase-3
MWRFKRWPSQHWAELAQHFTQSGYKVVLSGSGSDQDRRLNAEIVGLLPSDADFQVVDASGLLNLGQLGELLGRAALFVGVDTSVTHLAVAMGTSTVGLFGATTPTNFGPWPQKSVFRSLEKPSVWQLKGSQSIDDCRTQTIENVTLVQGPGPCVPCRKAGCLDKFESYSDCLDRLSVRAVINACNL